MRFSSLVLALAAAASLQAAIPPADWVPARWAWADPKTLDLLSDTPVNCLLLKTWDAAFVEQANQRGLITLAVLTPGGDAADAGRKAVVAHMQGVVLEGDFPDGTAGRVRDALADSKAMVIELTSRARMKLGGPAPIIGTYQGVWPGIQVLEDGHAKAGPTGSAWIDTNTGFIHSVRAWGNTSIWLGNRPPEKMIIPGERYLQAICDAAMAGARWVLALDDDFAGRLRQRESSALRDWKRIAQHLRFYESHREWRAFHPYGRLAVVQDPADGALLSGGILDMIAARHTPVRSIPRERLTPEALKDALMAVNVDSAALTPQQREILRAFTRSGGTLLTGPPGWKDKTGANQITLEKAELDHLNDIWRDVQSMIGRRNLGARLFNVSSMLSDLQVSPDGKQVIVQLVNYSSYPVEAVTVHMLGEFHHARLSTPEGADQELEIYKTEEGAGVDIPRISVCGTLRLD